MFGKLKVIIRVEMGWAGNVNAFDIGTILLNAVVIVVNLGVAIN